MQQYVYAVEVIIVKRQMFASGSHGLQFSTTRIQRAGSLDEFFESKEEAASFMREWLDTHRGEARIATFRVQLQGQLVAQTDESLKESRAWMGELTGYRPNLRIFEENQKRVGSLRNRQLTRMRHGGSTEER